MVGGTRRRGAGPASLQVAGSPAEPRGLGCAQGSTSAARCGPPPYWLPHPPPHLRHHVLRLVLQPLKVQCILQGCTAAGGNKTVQGQCGSRCSVWGTNSGAHVWGCQSSLLSAVQQQTAAAVAEQAARRASSSQHSQPRTSIHHLPCHLHLGILSAAGRGTRNDCRDTGQLEDSSTTQLARRRTCAC